MEALEDFFCPVCGYKLDFRSWVNNSPSDEICPCCGIQYGYDDKAGGDINMRHSIYKEWRNRWILEGMPWISTGIRQPDNWNPLNQLKNLNNESEK